MQGLPTTPETLVERVSHVSGFLASFLFTLDLVFFLTQVLQEELRLEQHIQHVETHHQQAINAALTIIACGQALETGEKTREVKRAVKNAQTFLRDGQRRQFGQAVVATLAAHPHFEGLPLGAKGRRLHDPRQSLLSCTNVARQTSSAARLVVLQRLAQQGVALVDVFIEWCAPRSVSLIRWKRWTQSLLVIPPPKPIIVAKRKVPEPISRTKTTTTTTTSKKRRRATKRATTRATKRATKKATKQSVAKDLVCVSQAPFTYYQGNVLGVELYDCVGTQNAVILADPPWHVAGPPYETLSDTQLLQWASQQLPLLFQPDRQHRCGLLAMWYTLEKEQLAQRMMERAGYTLLTKWFWIKLNQQDVPVSSRRCYGTNVEGLMVGIKSLDRGSSRELLASRAFFDHRYCQLHSSKPMQVYEELQFIWQSHVSDDDAWETLDKLELFARHSTKGWKAVGNEYVGQHELCE